MFSKFIKVLICALIILACFSCGIQDSQDDTLRLSFKSGWVYGYIEGRSPLLGDTVRWWREGFIKDSLAFDAVMFGEE